MSIGTSLPELVTSIVAARKNEVDMALGNAIGSNIFNILMVLGVASAISPITFIQENMIDIIVLVVFSLIVWIMAWTKTRDKKGRGNSNAAHVRSVYGIYYHAIGYCKISSAHIIRVNSMAAVLRK